MKRRVEIVLKVVQMKNYSEMFNSLLNLQREPVAISFLWTKEEYENCAAQPLIGKLPYCVMVRSATNGHRIKMKKENMGCKGAAKALGFVLPSKAFFLGEDSFNLGIYKDLATAQIARTNLKYCNFAPYGILLSPLNKINEAFDVLIFVSTPFNVMRLIQAYNYAFGKSDNFIMNGNQAMCAELTAEPFSSNSMNTSVMCSGTRMLNSWKEEEMGASVPWEKIDGLLDGLMKTINPLERNENKKIIEGKLRKLGTDNPEIEYDRNYDTGHYVFGIGQRR
jgi:uncharacterized protein (DUF169 family)